MSDKQYIPDQTRHSVASDLGLHCRLIPSVRILMINTVSSLIHKYKAESAVLIIVHIPIAPKVTSFRI